MDVTGDFPVISVVIFIFRSRILVNTALVWWGRVLIGYSSVVAWYYCVAELIFLRIWCICPLAVASYGGICFG